MKKKNGFTLIELLVTIALIISITGIAVVSFIKISDKRKEAAYEKVKEQIVTAAEEYFSVNAYYKEVLSSNVNNSIKVSLGTLVEDDYLNVVTDPKTGKKLNYCNYVKVSMNNKGRLSYDFKDDEEDCSANKFVQVEEKPFKGSTPTINIDVIGKKGNNDWYVLDENAEIKTPIIKITVSDESKIEEDIEVINKKRDDNFTESDSDFSIPLFEKNGVLTATDSISYSVSTKGKTTCYKVTNEYGNSTEDCRTLKTDFENPNCELKFLGISDGEVNKYKVFYSKLGSFPLVLVSLSYSDNISGVLTKKIKVPVEKDYVAYLTPKTQGYTNDSTKKWFGIVYDYAGNVSDCSRDIYVSKYDGLENFLNKQLNELYYTSCGKTEGENTTWTNKDVTITQYFDEKLITGTFKNQNADSKTQTFKETKKTADIEKNIGVNGNQTLKCEVDVYVDKTKPKYSYTRFDKEGNSTEISKGTIIFKSLNGSGKLVQKEEITVTKDDTGKYKGTACIDAAKLGYKPGKFNFSGFSEVAIDEHSGIASYQANRTLTGNDEKNNYTYCYYNTIGNRKANSPCTWRDVRTAVDRAGNKSDDFGKIEIKVGYKGKDTICK